MATKTTEIAILHRHELGGGGLRAGLAGEKRQHCARVAIFTAHILATATAGESARATAAAAKWRLVIERKENSRRSESRPSSSLCKYLRHRRFFVVDETAAQSPEIWAEQRQGRENNMYVQEE